MDLALTEGGFCDLTDDFCGAGCTTGPCKEDDWKSLSCDITNDEEKPGADRWREAETGFAFDEAINKWLDATGDGLETLFGEEKDDTRLEFPRFISAALGGPTGMRCRELVDRNGCYNYSDCENECDGPGTNLVLNSFVALNNKDSALRVMHAFNTWWYKNGQTNNPRPDEETDINASDMLSDIINMEIRAPGLVWLPVSGGDEAYSNWENSLNGKGKSAHCPCH
ncbi:hypothetical protein LCI18_011273 [Fusarium solani-melongenae]|uniref:Uncharacterized protein n=1 Tax=Fusarium solani subsp. cucurbitae TaxID=2747967 RepID=A0ACD3ZJR5_FUSSC|nr:hypothetical protein LCI18_011273 [Fusarium solani-melongenae]